MFIPIFSGNLQKQQTKGGEDSYQENKELIFEETNTFSNKVSGTSTARFSGVAIHIHTIDASTWASLKMPSVEVRGHAKAFYFVVDVMAYMPELILMPGSIDGRHKLIRKGAGFRIGVAAVGTDIEVTASLKMIAAKAQIRNLTIAYKQSLIGIHPEASTGLSLMNITNSNFSIDFFQSIREAAHKITDYLGKNWEDKNKVYPQPVEVTIIGGVKYDDKRLLYSHIAALEGICRHWTIERQLEHVKHWSEEVFENINITIMKDVYNSFGVVKKPNDEQANEAWHILVKGK